MSDLLLHPLLSGTRRLFLRDFIVDANIGVHAAEREGAQRLVLNVDVYVSLAHSTPRHDELAEVLDYDLLSELVRRRLALGHINLQETLVDDLVDEILALDPARVVAVRVRSEKPDIFHDVAGVGVEVLRLRSAPGAA